MLKVFDACNQSKAIRFADEVIRRLPFRIHVIQTDSGAEFQSRFHWHLEQLDIRHVYIRPRTPRLNGKVERSHRVDDQELYQLLDKGGISDDIRLFNDKLRECRRDRPCETARGTPSASSVDSAYHRPEGPRAPERLDRSVARMWQ